MGKILVFSLCCTMAAGQPLHITGSNTFTSGGVSAYSRYEAGISLNRAFSNPYDSSQINVWAVFTAPSGKTYTVNGFWYQPFARCNPPECTDPTSSRTNACATYDTATDAESGWNAYLYPAPTPWPWRIRFAPGEAGSWRYVIYAQAATGADSTYPATFAVVPAADKGFIRIAPNRRNFCYSDQTPFIPLGVAGDVVKNDTLYNRVPFVSSVKVIRSVASWGGNFFRLFMNPENFGIDYVDISGINNPGNFDSRQDRAFDLDSVLFAAEQNNVYLQIVTDVSSLLQYNGGWRRNPCNGATINGFVDSPLQFFTDARCLKMYKQKLRYMIARWGYSPHVFGFEPFQEIDQEDLFNFYDTPALAKIINWYRIIFQYGKALDPHHLYIISVTHGAPGHYNCPACLDNIPELDVINEHDYGADYNLEYQRNYEAREDMALFPDKPMFFGEMGGLIGGSYPVYSLSFTSGTLNWSLEWHNSLWSTLFSGAACPGLFWVQPEQLYKDPLQPAYSRCLGGEDAYLKPMQLFLQNEPIFSGRLTPIANFCTGTGPKDYPYYDTGRAFCPDSVAGDRCHCFPSWYEDQTAINPAYVGSGVLTTNDSLIEVFGLKTDRRVIGWVHDKQNYWYGVPHNTGIPFYDDNQPEIYPGQVPYLQNDSMSIVHLIPGRYKVAFYSTYPRYDTSGHGTVADGGVIPKFTQRVTVPPGSDTIKFRIPPMKPMAPGGSAPYAPDYGFKIIWLGINASDTVNHPDHR